MHAPRKTAKPAARARTPEPRPARERLLDAATAVFARDGLAGSTTREIARAAGVNEVTLFRLFSTKQNLLTAVLERIFAVPPAESLQAPEVEKSLHAIVNDYAVNYAANLRKNLALRRVLICEIQHFQEHELKAIRGIFEPTRQHLIGRLRRAQQAGLARREMNPFVVADQVSSMLFMGILKASLPLSRDYTANEFVNACVETIVRANEAKGGRR